MAWVHRQLRAVFGRARNGVDVREIQPWGNALGVEVHRQGDKVDVTGALAVAEQTALDAIRTGHDAQFGSRDGGATVIVGVQAEHHAVATGEVAMHPDRKSTRLNS